MTVEKDDAIVHSNGAKQNENSSSPTPPGRDRKNVSSEPSNQNGSGSAGKPDEKEKFSSGTPFHKASIFSRLTFYWINSWIHKAYKCKNLNASHLYPNIPEADAAHLNKRYEQYLTECKSTGRKPTIDGMIGKLFLRNYIEICFYQMMESLLKIAGCFVTIQFCDQIKQQNLLFALICGICSALLLIVNSASHHQVFFCSARMGMLARIVLTGSVYNKLMRLTIANDSAAGQIVNMVSNDVQKIEDYCVFRHFVWFSAIETVVVSVVVGLMTKSWALALILFFFVILLAFVQVLLSFRFTIIRSKMVATRDEMIRYITDLFTGMQVIKYYAWEEPFLSKIATIRSKVNRYLDQSAFLKAVNSILYYVTNDLITCIFLVFLVTCSSNSSFSSITALNLLGARQLFSVIVLVVCCFLPRSIELRSEASVSIKRIEQFMEKSDIEVRDEVGDPKLLNNGEFELVMRNASFNWPGESFLPANMSNVSLEDDSVPNDSPIALKNLNLSLTRGDLCLVVGPVGSGKSAFLNAILQEIDLVGGKLAFSGPISYASQNPWLMNRSIRDNILMGKPFDAPFYRQVLEAAALTRDIAQMQNGDHTIVGERGSALSGGQRARISLARALYYRDANIFLLDDVLSAVDTVVGNLLVKGIKRMLKEKVCILVTHQLQFVKFSTKVVLFEEGAIAFGGTYKELIRADHLAFVETLKAYDSLDDTHPVLSAIEELREGNQSDSSSNSSSSIPLPNNMPIDDILDDTAWLEHIGSVVDDQQLELPVTIVDDEEICTEKTGFSVYRNFFQSSGLLWAALLLMLISLGAQIMLLVFQNCIVDSVESITDFTTSHWILRYSGILFGIEIALFTIAIYALYLVSLKSAKALFNSMLRSVVRSPMHFFQRNPLGRILNRFSKDQTALDEFIYLQLSDAILLSFRTFLCFAVMLFLGFSVEILVIFAMIPIVIGIVWWRQRTFFKVSRDLKRIEATTRSPIYSHLSMTLEGLPIIRCFQVQSVFINDFFGLMNTNSQCLFSFGAISRWFSFNVDFSCCFFFIAYMMISVLALWIRKQLGKTSTNSITSVYQCVMYCQEIAELVQWTVRLVADVENSMTNVSRILQYTKLVPEAPAYLPSDKLLPQDWPDKGEISFNHMSIQYLGQEKPALHDICCKFKSGEKIALVGRTGAGKSSFLSALFRIVEATPRPGAIIIDDVDISTLGLATLRQRFSIIPQDPFLFKGDVRFNLDPFSEHSDSELWTALDSVKLLGKVEKMPGGLSATVLENGQNFSIGQKQLLCLARAILKKKRLIVMDEATANIDLATSQQIQQTIQRIFASNNVCTIAHRLHTVIDYDRIMVLDSGKIVEFDTPHALLTTDPAEEPTDGKIIGHFANMVKELGPEGEAHLIEVAKQTHTLKHNVLSE